MPHHFKPLAWPPPEIWLNISQAVLSARRFSHKGQGTCADWQAVSALSYALRCADTLSRDTCNVMQDLRGAVVAMVMLASASFCQAGELVPIPTDREGTLTAKQERVLAQGIKIDAYIVQIDEMFMKQGKRKGRA